MSLAREMSRQAADNTDLSPTSGGNDETELDLDRLVWDPEYRAVMRPLLRHDA